MIYLATNLCHFSSRIITMLPKFHPTPLLRHLPNAGSVNRFKNNLLDMAVALIFEEYECLMAIISLILCLVSLLLLQFYPRV